MVISCSLLMKDLSGVYFQKRKHNKKFMGLDKYLDSWLCFIIQKEHRLLQLKLMEDCIVLVEINSI